jgi:hypothetical protein
LSDLRRFQNALVVIFFQILLAFFLFLYRLLALLRRLLDVHLAELLGFFVVLPLVGVLKRVPLELAGFWHDFAH